MLGEYAKDGGKQDLSVPVIAIDGAACTGKGTIRTNVARVLGFNGLDSGILYRAVGVVCQQKGIVDEVAVAHEAQNLQVVVEGEKVLLNGVDQTALIRSDDGGKAASVVAQFMLVRQALRNFQLAMRRPPGLVADGRDVGFIFDNAHRFFLTAPPEVRAMRRLDQLRALKLEVSYVQCLREINRRDDSDKKNTSHPLRPHPRARIINTGELSIEEVVETILWTFGNPK